MSRFGGCKETTENRRQGIKWRRRRTLGDTESDDAAWSVSGGTGIGETAYQAYHAILVEEPTRQSTDFAVKEEGSPKMLLRNYNTYTKFASYRFLAFTYPSEGRNAKLN